MKVTASDWHSMPALTLVRIHLARLDVSARLAAVRGQLGHRTDARHAPDDLEAFAVAGAVGRPLLVIDFHQGNVSAPGGSCNSGKFLKGREMYAGPLRRSML